MKKLGLFITAVFALSVIFTGCNEETAEAAKTVEAVSVASVVPAGTAQQKKITNAEEFESIAAPAIGQDLEIYFGGLFDSDEPEEGVLLPPSGNPLTSTIARVAGTVTIEQLKAALEEVPKKFNMEGENACVTFDEKTNNFKIDVDWKGPTGTIDTGDSPVELKISSLNFNIKGSAGMASETSVKGSGSAAASAGASLSLTPAEAEAIKSFKLNSLAAASANVAFDVNPSTEEEGMSAAVKSVSGNVNLYAGASGALCFEVTKDGEVYNGVISATATISVDSSVSKETLSKIEALMNSEEFNAAAADELPVSVNLVMSVYDVEGNKLFDYVNVTKISDFAALFNED